VFFPGTPFPPLKHWPLDITEIVVKDGVKL
jgi:hypothetical protein